MSGFSIWQVFMKHGEMIDMEAIYGLMQMVKS